MNEIMAIQQNKVQITDTGLELTENLSINDYMEVGTKINALHKSTPWLLADLLGYGEERYGDQFSQVVDEFGYRPETLRNALYTVKRWPKSRRRPELTFAHHQAVSSLDPENADKILELAIKFDWSVKELRDEKRKALKIVNDEPEEEEITICCPNCSLELDAVGIYNKVKRFLGL